MPICAEDTETPAAWPRRALEEHEAESSAEGGADSHAAAGDFSVPSQQGTGVATTRCEQRLK